MTDQPSDASERPSQAQAGVAVAEFTPGGGPRRIRSPVRAGSSGTGGSADRAPGEQATAGTDANSAAGRGFADRQDGGRAPAGAARTDGKAPLPDRLGPPARPATRPWTARPAAALAAAALALVLALSVYLINGAPLFYRDTGAYLDQGRSMVEALGLVPAVPPASAPGPEAAAAGRVAPTPAPVLPEPSAQAAPAPAAHPSPSPDKTVDASRSAVYGLILALLDAALPIDVAVLANLALIWAAALLVARRFAVPSRLPAPFLAAIGLAAASLGALPFYVASLMPDILAPILLLMIALLCAFWPRLSRWERVAAALLTVFAIVCHPSHLLTAAILLPLGLFVSPLLKGRRLAVAAGLAIALLGAGVLERVAFVTAVEKVEAREVRMLPFLTARLVADGPGLDYLAAHCPDPALATCAMLEPLSRSAAPARLLSANILFSRDAETGSFRLLDEAEQTAIAAEQIAFARRVAAADPAGVLAAFGGNVLTQLGYVRVDMTLPWRGLRDALQRDFGAAAGSLRNGALVESGRGWLEPLAAFHAAVYLVSALGLGLLVLFPAGLPAGTRTFLLLIFAGLVVHAAVCGGISVPAHRYGARVALVLPLLAGLLLLPALWSRRSGRAPPPGPA